MLSPVVISYDSAIEGSSSVALCQSSAGMTGLVVSQHAGCSSSG